MSDIKEWDVVADDNSSSPPHGAPEGMAAQTFNNVIREAMAAVKRNWAMTHVSRRRHGKRDISILPGGASGNCGDAL